MQMYKANEIAIAHPSLALYESFVRFHHDMEKAGETLWDGYCRKEGESPEDFVNRLNLAATSPELPRVPESIYWITLNGDVAGRISLRHHLAGNLFKIGGHIGYETGPSFRRKGVATNALRLILQTAQAKEVGRLLLTCSPMNHASNRTILSNNGVLEKTAFVDLVNEDRNYYWISLDSVFFA